MCLLVMMNYMRIRKMKKNYSTRQAAAKARVSLRTLNRWLSQGKVKASIAVPLGGGRTLWRWTKADIAKARKVRAAQKPGPKPSGKERNR